MSEAAVAAVEGLGAALGLGAASSSPRRARRPGAAWLSDRGRLLRRLLCLADLSGLVVAFVAAQPLSAAGGLHGWAEGVILVGTLPAWVLGAKLYGLYDGDQRRADHATIDDARGVFHLVTVGSWLVFAGVTITRLAEPNLGRLAIFWALSFALIVVGRAGARAASRRSRVDLQNTLIVGGGSVGQTVARKLVRHPEYGLKVVGFVDEGPVELRPGLGQLSLLGGTQALPALVRSLGVERVVIACPRLSRAELLALVCSLSDLYVQIDLVPDLYEILGDGLEIHSAEGLPLIGLPPPRLSSSSRLVKRTLDVVAAAGALLLLAPLFALVALLIKRDSRGPVLFSQLRRGVNGRQFTILKFRTMVADAEAQKAALAHLNGHAQAGDPRLFKVAKDPRVTGVGRFLRRYLLDELPQLLNVLRGEMSLVGPRPLILEEDEHVQGWGRKRRDVKPGMTGPWQVLGRNAICFEEMLRLDYVYVASWSLWNDVRWLWRTIPLVLRGDGGAY